MGWCFCRDTPELSGQSGRVALRVLRVLASTAGLAPEVVLLGKASRAAYPFRLPQLGFDGWKPLCDRLESKELCSPPLAAVAPAVLSNLNYPSL